MGFQRIAAICCACLVCSSPLRAQSPQAANPASEIPTEPTPAATGAVPLNDAHFKELHEKLDHATDPDQRFDLSQQLIREYDKAGRVADSLKSREDLVNDALVTPGRRSIAASALALTEALLGEYRKAERLVATAKELAQKTTPAEIETLVREPSYTYLNAEAEIARRAQGRHDIALMKYREHEALAWSNFNDPNLSEKRRRAAANELLNDATEETRIMVQNNRRTEALSFARQLNQYINTRPDLKPSMGQRARIDSALAIALCSFDDYDAALKAVDQSLDEYRRAGVEEHDPAYGNALRLRLMIALSMGRLRDYLPDVEALDRGRAIDPVLAHSFASEEAEALGLGARGQWSAASDRIGVVMQNNLRHLGSGSPFYKYQAAMQMLFRLQDPEREVTYGEIDRYATPLSSSDDDWSDALYRGSYTEDGALTMSMDRLMRPGSTGDPALAQALAFRISELLRLNATQGALTDGAARLAAGNPKLRALIEQEQSLRFEQSSSQRSFAASADRLDRMARQNQGDAIIVKRQSDEVADKEKALAASAGKLAQLRREISAQFPVYRELVAPSIPSPARLGQALHANEAYINLYAGHDASYVYVVQAGGQLTALRIPVTREQLKTWVSAVRKGFDEGTPPSTPGELAGFDLAAAQNLFQTLIAPVQPQLQGVTTVYLSTNGLLSSVPWDVLVTRPTTKLADAQWWISSVTPVQMPSASSLVLARAHTAARAAMPFAAFADPSFDGQTHAPTDTVPTRSVRAAAVRSTASQAPELDYHLVTPLPETYDEVKAIASVLSAPPQSIVRGTDATRTAVLKDDLSDVRVVEFATHGLLPGEVPQMLKAGLAMAYEGRGLSDSVLTIDDIVGLRLNADWVVLSACNTGFASGSAGDSMSALSRGFFAAGSRSVLATQWSVESQSAKELTVGVFTRYAADPKLSKADALAQTQREMLSGKYGALYQHPYFWAPYFLAGDASR